VKNFSKKTLEVVTAIIGMLVVVFVCVFFNLLLNLIINPNMKYPFYDTLSGEEIAIKEQINFYFKSDYGYKLLDPNTEIESDSGKKIKLKDIMLLEMEIVTPIEFEIKQSKFDISKKDFKISSLTITNEELNTHKSSQKGLALFVNATINIKEIPTGVYDIRLKAPGLALIGELSKTNITFISNDSIPMQEGVGRYIPHVQFYNSDTMEIYPIAKIYVHSNLLTKNLSAFWHLLISTNKWRIGSSIGVILILALVIFLPKRSSTK
jgi:hypothetical protein